MNAKSFVIFLILVISSTIIGQDKTKTANISPLDNSKLKINTDASDILNSIQNQNSFGNSNFKIVSLEDAINSDTYIVGPNDQFNLGVFGYINQQISLIVSPEGFLVIPTIGEIKAAGITITDLREKVNSAVKKRYYSSDVSLTLSVPRTFLVTISGLKQGTYEASSVIRVSTVVNYVLMQDTMNLIKSYESKQVVRDEKFFDIQPSLRNIELKRKNGIIQKVDLYKYFMTKDDKFNPFLSEGDFIKIPYTLLSHNYITVNGAIQLSGTYEFSEGDDLETVIGLGRGFDQNAEPDSIIIYRPYGDNKGFNLINLSYNKDKNFKINAFDRVSVNFKSTSQKNITIMVLGEVQRPGFYPINFKNTRIKDVIDMAGGFRENAYLPLCVLFRKYDDEYVRKDTAEILINERANDVIISEGDRKNFETDILSKRNRVVVDFEKLYKNNDESQNIILEDKDVIYINDDKKIVYVYGQVNNEGYIQYIDGKDYEYYVERAGGYSLGADESHARIIKFNSRGWYKAEDTKINSGDYIYIPKIEKKSFSDIMTIIAQISGVVLGVLTTYILIKSNTK